MSFSSTNRQVEDELRRIEEDGTHTGKSHFEACSRWGSYHFWIGIPAVAIGAMAGAAFFRAYPEVGGALALCAALLTALQTFLKPAEHAANHKAAGDGYLALKNDARIYRTVTLLTADDADAAAALADLNQRRNELNRTSPQFWKMDRRKALKSIEKGETEYRVDRGRGA
jgi:hypothetical protein